jgi:MFS family permease
MSHSRLEIDSLPCAEAHTRWNFVIIVLDCAFFMFGMAFVDPTAVLPVLLFKLTDSSVVIGLMGGMQRAGWLLPQLLSASFVLHRPRKWPFMFYPCLISRIPFLVLAAVLMLPWARSHPQAVLLLLFAGYGTFFFGDGFSGVPWHDIIARSIPATLRGRFFGSMQFLGGLLAVGSGAIVVRVLSDRARPFPSNYGLLFALLSIGMVLSTICLSLIREPKTPVLPEPRPLPELIRSIPRTLRQYPRLLQLILTQNLCGLSGLAVMYYALYAVKRLHLPDSEAGIFVWFQVIGSVGFSFVWAFLCDRRGSTKVIRTVACIIFLTPMMALLTPVLGHALGSEHLTGRLYALVFLLLGATAGGAWIGFTNYVMEIAPDELRPLFLGMAFTLSAPSVLMPVIGGVLLKVISFETLFALVMVIGMASAIFARRLPEPRGEAV